MQYRQTSHNGISIDFEGLEVDVVREAYTERILHLMSLGNEGSVSDYQKWIARWTGPKQTYNAAGQEPLVDTLQRFHEATDERVDEILDSDSGLSPYHYEAAGKRYELGHSAAHLLMSIELQSSIESEWQELLDDIE